MRRHNIEGDGNCCFSAVAFSLLRNSKLILQSSPDFFEKLGLDISGNFQTVGKQLKHLTVTEWTQNAHDYEGFVPDVDIQQEAYKFLQSGYFFGELGNTIVLALSNMLGLPIIFSSSIGQPVITITPRQLHVPLPVHLAFNQSGAGHYDCALLCDMERSAHLAIQPTTKVIDGCCSCGKNDKMKRSHCHPVASKYTTVLLCKCCKEEKACTNACRCKTCKNPFGKKPLMEMSIQMSRKRPRHQWQRNIPKSVNFAIDAGEHVTSGSRSMLDFFILESILKHCSRERIEVISSNIEKIFNGIVEISDTLDEKLQIGKMSIDGIERFFKGT